MNSKLIRYAGYGEERGFKGDPDERAFTAYCEALGWRGSGSDFDLLPVVIDMPGHDIAWFEWEPGDAMEVLITHPDLKWFSELALRWYAVPIVSNMTLGIGGLEYTAAPFNGWFMGTEVGARNLSDVDRYNVLPEIAERMHLDTADQVALWRDRALVELNTAVLHSFSEAGVRMVDHHTASAQFMKFCRDEDRSGRSVTGDWAGWFLRCPDRRQKCFTKIGTTKSFRRASFIETIHTPQGRAQREGDRRFTLKWGWTSFSRL